MKKILITILILVGGGLHAQRTFQSQIVELDLTTSEESGLVEWSQEGPEILQGFAWTWGVPGMKVWGEEDQLGLDIEAHIKNVEHEWAAGLAIGIQPSSQDTQSPYNGINSYYLQVYEDRILLSQGINHTGEGFEAAIIDSAQAPLDQTDWYILRLELDENTIKGYLNDSLYISHTPDTIQKWGKMAIVSSNSKNHYANIRARYHKDPRWVSNDTIVEFVSDPNHIEWDNLPVVRLDRTETEVASDGVDHYMNYYIEYRKDAEVEDSDQICECECPTNPTLNIYPNPVSDWINVSIQQEQGLLRVFNMARSYVGVYELKRGVNKIEVSRFAADHYIFKIEYEGRTALTKKIIISH